MISSRIQFRRMAMNRQDMVNLARLDRIAGVHLTYRCDLNCPGCNRASFIKHLPIPDLTLSRFADLLDQIESLGFDKYLEILGGEPTLHPECLEFMRLAKARDFQVVIWSNAYGHLSQEVLAAIKQEGIGRINAFTQKPKGRQEEFLTRTIYCSPADCGLQSLGCGWAGCGYSVDGLGVTVCNIGGPLAYYTCPEAYTQDLRNLLNVDWVEQSFRLLCRHCGAFLDDKLLNRAEVSNVNGTLMTKTWIKAFGL